MSEVPTNNAAPAATPTPAAPTPAVPQTPAPEAKHPGVSKLMSSLFQAAESDKKPEPEKKEPEPKPEVKPEPEKKEPEPKPEPIKVRKAKAPVRPELPVAQPPPVAQPAAPAPAAKEPMPELYEEEKAYLDEMSELERRLGNTNPKYKGLTSKVEKFIRDHAKWVAQPDFDQNDEAYQAFLRTKPQMTSRDVAALEADRVTEKLTKDHEEKLNGVRQEVFERDELPKVKQETHKIFQELAQTSLPDDLAAMIKEKGVEHAQKEMGLEYSIAEMVLKAATDDIEEFKRVTRINPSTGRPLKAFDEKNEQHQRLVKVVDDVCEQYKTNNPQALLKDGKWFVTRREWNAMPPANRNQFWTFSNDEVIPLALKSVKPAMQAAIDQERARIEKYNYHRPKPAPAAAAPVEAPPPTIDRNAPPPAARPSPVPNTPANGNSDGIDPRAKSLARMLGN